MEDNAYQYYCNLCAGIRMLSAQIAQGQQALVPSDPVNSAQATATLGATPATAADIEQLSQKLAILNENMGYLNQAIINQESYLVQIYAFLKENIPVSQESQEQHSPTATAIEIAPQVASAHPPKPYKPHAK